MVDDGVGYHAEERYIQLFAQLGFGGGQNQRFILFEECHTDFGRMLDFGPGKIERFKDKTDE